MPCRRSPHKPRPPRFAGELRLAMLERAVAGHPGLSVSPVELEREAPSYTVDTLERIAAAEPGELWLMLGADQLAAFGRWHRAERILELARLAVAGGRDRGAPGLDAAVAAIGSDRIDWVAMPRIDLSASMLRERIARGLPVDHLMPPGVAELAGAGRDGLIRSAPGE